MSNFEQVDSEPFRQWLRKLSFERANEFDELWAELSPIFEFDRSTESRLFRAVRGEPNIIRAGVKGSVRLQVNAFAAAIVFSTVYSPEFRTMTPHQLQERLFPSDVLHSWSVGNDLKQRLANFGETAKPEDLLPGGLSELPTEVLDAVCQDDRVMGQGMFKVAIAFILFHELGHLKLGHIESTPQSEHEADRFAAEWMLESASKSEGNRLCAMAGISIALLWITVFNIYFGDNEVMSHPQGYERLWNVLNHVTYFGDEDEGTLIWDFIVTMLQIHMDSAGFDFEHEIDSVHLQGAPKDVANYLIDRIANWDRKRDS